MRIPPAPVLPLALVLAPALAAQHPPLTDQTPLRPTLPGGARAVADEVAGPFDVQNGPATPDPRMLGVESAWGFYWVSGANDGSPMLYKFDQNGSYIEAFPQTTSSPYWGHRDGESDEAANLLWFGEENGNIVEYDYDPITQSISYGQTIHAPNTGWVVRALCVDPVSSNFFLKDFVGEVYEVTSGGTMVNSFVNPDVSAYGFAWNATTSTIWATSSWSELVELDPATGLETGNRWDTNLGGPQGGCDIYLDPRNPAEPSLVALHQSAVDSLVVYDLDGGGASNPTISLSNLVAGQQATLSVTGATPGSTVRVGTSWTGAGPTTLPNGLVVDLSPPITVLPDIAIGAGGNGSLTGTVHPATQGFTLYAHGAELPSLVLTNSLAEVVQ